MEYNLESRKAEYIELGKRIGLIDYTNEGLVRSRLCNIELVEDKTLPGEAQVIQHGNKRILIVNPSRLAFKPDWYIDEVFFHEFTHAANEIDISIADFRDHNRGEIAEFIEFVKNMRNRYHYENPNPLAQMPEWGFLLLDEAIAQQVAQSMNKIKYGENLYQIQPYRPPIYPDKIAIMTTFTDYKEYERPAQYFSRIVFRKKTDGSTHFNDSDILGLANLSLRDQCLDKIFTTVDYNELYDILGYIGNIAIAEYYTHSKFKLKDSEELRDKDNLVKSFVFIRDYKSKKD